MTLTRRPPATRPSAPFIGAVLSGLMQDGVNVALEDVAKVRAGEEKELSYSFNGYAYEITPDEAHLLITFDDRYEGTITLDLWEECLRRYAEWMATQGPLDG